MSGVSGPVLVERGLLERLLSALEPLRAMEILLPLATWVQKSAAFSRRRGVSSLERRVFHARLHSNDF